MAGVNEKQKPTPAPGSWRGKPVRPLPPMPKLPPPRYEARPNLLMRIGSWFFERRTGK